MKDRLSRFQELVNRLKQEVPEIAEFLDSQESDEGTLQELIEALEDDSVIQRVSRILTEVQEDDPAILDDSLRVMESATGMKRINPLWEAALAERLQFDGDVPEFRNTPLRTDLGQKAAVPVQTNVSNPLMIGLMLQASSEKVTAEAATLLGFTKSAVKGFMDHTLDHTLDHTVLVDQEWIEEDREDDHGLVEQMTSGLTADPKTYKRGAPAALVTVPQPGITELVALTKEESQKLIWSVKSTTQGRVSALAPITGLVIQQLSLEVGRAHPGSVPDKDPVALASWESHLDEAKHLNSAFSAIHTAAAVLARKLENRITELGVTEQSFLLIVTPINTIHKRKVGWDAALYFKHELPEIH